MIKIGAILPRFGFFFLLSLLLFSEGNAQGRRFLAILPFSNSGSADYAWISGELKKYYSINSETLKRFRFMSGKQLCGCCVR